MQVALIGLPQSGKRTLFTLLTGRAIPAGRTAEESVEGVAPINDPRVDRLAEICHPKKKTYAQNRLVLCPDASLKGDDRAWLEAARKCELVCLVVRAFESDRVYHPSGSVDPGRDRSALESELMLADLERVDTRLTRIGKEKRGHAGPEQAMEEKALHRAMAAMEEGRRLRDAGLEPHELRAIRSLGLLTLMPQLCVYNVSESEAARSFGAGTMTVSALIEQEIAAMEDPGERREYLRSMGLDASGLDRLNAAAYDALGLMSFYTIGPDEARAWTIRKGATAPEAGGRIHTDMERGFIRVEVIRYDALLAAGSEAAAREAGRAHAKGRDYVLQDGDVCHFLFNV